MRVFGINLIVFLVIFDIKLTSGYDDSTGDAYIPCHQSVINNTYEVDCYSLNLKSVPKCHSLNVTDCKRIRKMNLGGNQITHIKNGSFIEYPNLEYLNLTHNPIELCENGAFVGLTQLKSLSFRDTARGGGRHQPYTVYENETFTPLKNLKYLDISKARLDVKSIFEYVLCGVSSSIETLLMDRIFHFSDLSSFVMLNSQMSKCFLHMRLKKLSLRHNKIVEISTQFIISVRHLEYLSLRDNNIIGDRAAVQVLVFVHNLTFLDMGCQNSWTCYYKYTYPVTIPSLEEENIPSQSESHTINRKQIEILPKLRTLRIDHFAGYLGDTELPNICWTNNHLIELDISYLSITSITGKMQCLRRLEFLNMRGIKVSAMDPVIFQDLIALKILLFDEGFSSNMMLGKDSAVQFFKNNRNLIYLELSRNGIDSLHVDVFNHLDKLKFLNLSHNQIQHVDDQFMNLTSLERVDLSYNLLTQIPMELFSLLDTNMKFINSSSKAVVDITGNPFQCSCTVMSQIRWLERPNVKVHVSNLNSTKLFCFLQNGTRIPFFEVGKQLEKICHDYDYTLTIIFFTFIYPLCLIVITLSTCGYKYRWRVKYAWYTVLNLFYNKEQERTDFRFDAFISYCSDDEDWVRTKLVENLERDEENKYNLCLHYRHFVPGRGITENIAAAIKVSRKTVLVVTKNYLNSGWCDFETKFAHTHHLHKHTGGIIGIIHPELFKIKGNRATALDRLLDSVTYLEWPIEEQQEPLFWLRLKRALGPPLALKRENDHLYDMLEL